MLWSGGKVLQEVRVKIRQVFKNFYKNVTCAPGCDLFAFQDKANGSFSCIMEHLSPPNSQWF